MPTNLQKLKSRLTTKQKQLDRLEKLIEGHEEREAQSYSTPQKTVQGYDLEKLYMRRDRLESEICELEEQIENDGYGGVYVSSMIPGDC